jgi:hypothetical protein
MNSHFPSSTRHGLIRSSQRGFSTDVIELITLMGEEVNGDGILLTSAAANSELERISRQIKSLRYCSSEGSEPDLQAEQQIAALRQRRERIEKCRGKKIVIVDGWLVTCYHASALDQKRSLRRARRAGRVRGLRYEQRCRRRASAGTSGSVLRPPR